MKIPRRERTGARRDCHRKARAWSPSQVAAQFFAHFPRFAIVFLGSQSSRNSIRGFCFLILLSRNGGKLASIAGRGARHPVRYVNVIYFSRGAVRVRDTQCIKLTQISLVVSNEKDRLRVSNCSGFRFSGATMITDPAEYVWPAYMHQMRAFHPSTPASADSATAGVLATKTATEAPKNIVFSIFNSSTGAFQVALHTLTIS